MDEQFTLRSVGIRGIEANAVCFFSSPKVETPKVQPVSYTPPPAPQIAIPVVQPAATPPAPPPPPPAPPTPPLPKMPTVKQSTPAPQPPPTNTPNRVEVAEAQNATKLDQMKRKGQAKTLLAGETGGFYNPATGPKSLLG